MQVEAAIPVEDDPAAHGLLQGFEEFSDLLLAGAADRRDPKTIADVNPGFVDLQMSAPVGGAEPRTDRQDFARRHKHRRRLTPDFGQGGDTNLRSGGGREAEVELLRSVAIVESQLDFGSRPTPPPAGEAPERFRTKHADQFPGDPARDSLLRRSSGVSVPGLGRTHGEERVGQLEQVGLAEAVFPHDDVETVPEIEAGLRERGEVLERQRPDHDLVFRALRLSEGAGSVLTSRAAAGTRVEAQEVSVIATSRTPPERRFEPASRAGTPGAGPPVERPRKPGRRRSGAPNRRPRAARLRRDLPHPSSRTTQPSHLEYLVRCPHLFPPGAPLGRRKGIRNPPRHLASSRLRSPGWTSFKCRRRTSFRCRLTPDFSARPISPNPSHGISDSPNF